MPGPTTDVFVSYKAEDRSRLAPLVSALEHEGFTVWWDAHIGGGTNWQADIEQHLDAAKCVIVAWSKRSIGHDGHFVRDEAREALKRDAYVPVCLDPVEPPLGFREVQALPLKGWKGDPGDHQFQAVAAAVRSHISGEHVPHVPLRKPRISRRAAIAGGAGVAAAAAGGWFILTPAAINAKRIAVLPFANMSSDQEQAYFADGVAEELRAALSRIGLEVIGRASSDAVKNLDTKAAAAKLGVPHLLTGSVRRSPATIRVNAQLLSGKDGVEHWAETYDRAPGDAIKIQTDIATNVAEALSFALGQAGRAALTIGGTNNPRAQDLLLQATAASGRDDSEAKTLATIALLDRAINLDPNYAEAHGRKAQYVELWASQFAASVSDKERAISEATQSAQSAITIAPRMSLGYGALAAIHQDQLQLKRSLREFERADALPGAEIVTLAVYAVVLIQSRQQVEALSTIERAITLDPLNPLAPELKAWILFFGRRYEESAAAARRALELEPERFRATAFLGNALLMLGRTDEALRQFRRTPADDYRRLVGEAIIAARANRPEEALKAIPAIQKRYGDTAFYQFGQIYAQVGIRDRALDALETALVKRDPGVASIQVDPFLDPVRNDSRLSAIAARVFG